MMSDMRTNPPFNLKERIFDVGWMLEPGRRGEVNGSLLTPSSFRRKFSV